MEANPGMPVPGWLPIYSWEQDGKKAKDAIAAMANDARCAFQRYTEVEFLLSLRLRGGVQFRVLVPGGLIGTASAPQPPPTFTITDPAILAIMEAQQRREAEKANSTQEEAVHGL